jgi:hypothetical protein
MIIKVLMIPGRCVIHEKSTENLPFLYQGQDLLDQDLAISLGILLDCR